MRSNSSQKKLQQINRIIIKKYKPSEKSLNLDEQRWVWNDVLKAGNWSILERLYLKKCGITDNNASELFEMNWPHLIDLDLCKNLNKLRNHKISKERLAQIVDPQFKQVWSKSAKNNITNEGLSAILEKFYQRLVELWIQNCGLTSQGMQSMMKWSPQNLKSLELAENSIGNRGIKYLVKANLPNLETLDIRYCKIGSEGIKHLTKGKWLKLIELYLGLFSKKHKQNKINLNGWQMISQNQCQQLVFFVVHEKEPICWMNYVLVEKKKNIIIYKNGIEVSNLELRDSIIQILKQRNLLE